MAQNSGSGNDGTNILDTLKFLDQHVNGSTPPGNNNNAQGMGNNGMWGMNGNAQSNQGGAMKGGMMNRMGFGQEATPPSGIATSGKGAGKHKVQRPLGSFGMNGQQTPGSMSNSNNNWNGNNNVSGGMSNTNANWNPNNNWNSGGSTPGTSPDHRTPASGRTMYAKGFSEQQEKQKVLSAKAMKLKEANLKAMQLKQQQSSGSGSDPSSSPGGMSAVSASANNAIGLPIGSSKSGSGG